MTFRILSEAQFDAIEAATWYDRCQPLLGDDFQTEVERSLDKIRNEVHSIARLETYTGKLDIRGMLLKKFPYLVVVLCREQESVVVAITHVRRRPNHWLGRLNKA
jgi:hypothetical protein